MKKLLSIILTLTLVMSMSIFGFAEEATPTTNEDMKSIQIEKLIKLTNDGTINPAETYNFTIKGVDVKDSSYTVNNMPKFDPATFSISLAEGVAKNSTVLNLPEYSSTGAFTYEITETRGNTAGITYDGRTLVLTVYVLNNPEGGFIRYVTLHDKATTDAMKKETGFGTEFSAGDLAITKTVEGNMGETNREFEVTVNLTAPEGKDISTVPATFIGGKYAEAQNVTFDGGVANVRLQLKHNDTVTIKNLPYGVTWNISEEDIKGEGYTTTYSNGEGTIAEASHAAGITNAKDQGIKTGINFDNLPYIIILVVVAGGLFTFIMRKRLSNNE